MNFASFLLPRPGDIIFAMQMAADAALHATLAATDAMPRSLNLIHRAETVALHQAAIFSEQLAALGQKEECVILNHGQIIHVRRLRPDETNVIDQHVRALTAEDVRLRFYVPGYDKAITDFSSRLRDNKSIVLAAWDSEKRPVGLVEIGLGRNPTDRLDIAFSVLIKHEGLASKLCELAFEHAAAGGYPHLQAEALLENTPMVTLGRGLFPSVSSDNDGIVFRNDLDTRPFSWMFYAWIHLCAHIGVLSNLPFSGEMARHALLPYRPKHSHGTSASSSHTQGAWAPRGMQ